MTDLATTAPGTEAAAPVRPNPAGSAWLKWLARRLGLAVLTLWLCSVLVFFATAALGDPVRAILGKDYATSPERVAALTAQLKLDEPVITRYFQWLGGLFTGNLGESVANGLPVGSLVGDRIVNSAVLVLVSALVMIPVAFGIALVSANFRGKRTDSVIQIIMITAAGLPEFVVGILVIAVAPYVARIVRSSLLEVLDSDYVELARLKGVPERVVLRKHALLNAIVPGIQVIALQLAWLAGGVVIVEYLFSYPGIGASLVDSVRNSDFPMVQVLAMTIAGVYVVVNLIADILSILFTPRARTAIAS